MKLIDIRGKSYQKRYDGINLLQNQAFSGTLDGVEFTVNDDGSIIANGTSTNDIDFMITDMAMLDAGTYTLSGCPSTGGENYFLYLSAYGDYEDHGNGVTVTYDQEVQAVVAIFIETGITLNNVTFYPMINVGTEALSYEPYVGGMPSPNPYSPQEIVNTEINASVLGGNFYNVHDIITSNVDYAVGSIDDEDYITISYDNTAGTAIKYCNQWTNNIRHLKPDTEYKLVVEIKELINASIFAISRKTPDNTESQFKENVRIDSAGTHEFIVKTNDGTKWDDVACYGLRTFAQFVAGVSGKAIFRISIMPVKAKFRGYLPYAEQQNLVLDRKIRAIPVSDPEFATYTDSDGQMWCADEIDIQRGVYVQRVGLVEFDGSTDEVWYLYNNDDQGTSFYIRINDAAKGHSISLCDRFINIPMSWIATYIDNYGIYSDHPDGPNKYFRPSDSRSTTLDDWKLFLRSNPIKLQYVLAASVETALTSEEIVALTAFINHLTNAYPKTPYRRYSVRAFTVDLLGIA